MIYKLIRQAWKDLAKGRALEILLTSRANSLIHKMLVT